VIVCGNKPFGIPLFETYQTAVQTLSHFLAGLSPPAAPTDCPCWYHAFVVFLDQVEA
jgi:hypothetical protein